MDCQIDSLNEALDREEKRPVTEVALVFRVEGEIDDEKLTALTDELAPHAERVVGYGEDGSYTSRWYPRVLTWWFKRSEY